MSESTGDPADRPPRRAVRQPGTVRIGQIAGVDVLVRSSWLFVAAFLSVAYAPQVEYVQPGLGGWKYVAGLAFAVLLYLTVLLHEASHALMAQHYGMPVRSITLHFLGGVTEMEGEPDTPGREFGVSVVGPLTSLGVGLVFLALTRVTGGDLIGLAVEALAWSNLVVGVINLVPGLPLDGGRVLRSAIWKATGNPHRGTIVAGYGGRASAVVVLLYPFVLAALGARPGLSRYAFAVIIAAFLWSGASESIVSARVRRRLPSLRARTLARRTLTVPHDLPLAEAVRRAREEQAGSIVTLDSTGLPVGIVNEAAVAATPEDRMPWMPVSAVSRTIDPGVSLTADLAGEPLIRAMQQSPATEYLLLDDGGRIYGVLVTDDVDRAFAAGAAGRG